MTRYGTMMALIGGVLLQILLAAGVVGAGEPVHFRQLLPLVDINLPAWEKDGEASGTTVKNQGITFTEVEGRYKKGDQTIQIRILDNPTVPMSFVGLGYALGMVTESTEESVKGTKIFEYPALETMRFKDKEAKIELLAADRFLVVLEGQGFTDIKPLKEILAAFPLPELAELAK
ncbi:MAG: hypothetical protein ACUVRZ_09460 [Desulfobacca sp.]|uniref:hypothetical protein n=1 Tax=Desulfobacca sp. TaxID=2067990 RepID=UPI00404A802F